MLNCPECGSKRLYRDGLRYSVDGNVQRYLCRNCGFRFSEHGNSNKECLTHKDTIQICATLQGAKNLDTATETKTVAGDEQTVDQKSKYVQFLWTLKKDGVRENTARMYVYILDNLRSCGAELLDPESVKAAIAERAWCDKTKALAVSAYGKYLSVFGGTWQPPKYRTERKIPFLPTQKELDDLISAGNRKQAAYLTLLKETGMRANEAYPLKWENIDFEHNIITLNDTEKHGTPRMFKVSSNLIAMLNVLPKNSEQVFSGTLISFSKGFRSLRARTASKLQNPRLNKISFHTFRHHYATMEYFKTKNILHVKERLGHKSLNTTEIYTHLINFEADQFHSASARTIEEASKLIESGFEYVCDVQDVKLFRKPK